MVEYCRKESPLKNSGQRPWSRKPVVGSSLGHRHLLSGSTHSVRRGGFALRTLLHAGARRL